MLVCTVEPATTDDIPALFGQTHISHPLSHLIQAFWSRGKTNLVFLGCCCCCRFCRSGFCVAVLANMSGAVPRYNKLPTKS